MANQKSDPKEEANDDDDDDVEDLVSAINYNTITSMAALKEILGKNTSSEDVSWFQHYFLRHVNRLPSRSQYPGRRLSECKEEDEGQDGGDVKSESPRKEPKFNESTTAIK